MPKETFRFSKLSENKMISTCCRSIPPEVFQRKGVHAASLQENTHVKGDFNKVTYSATLLKPHFNMGVLL